MKMLVPLTSKSIFCSIRTKTSLLEPVKKLNCLNDSVSTNPVKVLPYLKAKGLLVDPPLLTYLLTY